LKLRFKIEDAGATQFSDWIEESVRHRQAGIPTATSEMERLRTQYPHAAISIERDYIIVPPKPKTFRYEVFVPEGRVTVADENGQYGVPLINATLQSRPFQEAEQAAVLAEVMNAFPNAQLTMREVK
jgi:hypothetical protein